LNRQFFLEPRITSTPSIPLNQGEPAGIYIHIPFCVQKCPYCDFYSTTDLSQMQALTAALALEIRMRGSRELRADTLYIGGGTPSILDVDHITILLDSARRWFDILPDTEITLEVNPGTVDLEDLKAYRTAGVNRLSIGVQSFEDQHLQFLGRIHTADQAVRTITRSREAGFDNIGLDLIYGIPGQTKASWTADLAHALAFEPEHLSCYMLTFEPGTPMDRRRTAGQIMPLDDSAAGELFDTTQKVLAAGGYGWYEVSNYARSRRYRSRHNQKYWSFTPYVGIGPSAHSLTGNCRSWNYSSLEQYIRKLNAGVLPIESEEALTEEQQMIESVYLGLRQDGGIDLAAFNERHHHDFRDLFEDTIDRLQKEACLKISPTRCSLTPKGMRFLDSIVSMLVNEDFPKTL